jgi:hypothetical protein
VGACGELGGLGASGGRIAASLRRWQCVTILGVGAIRHRDGVFAVEVVSERSREKSEEILALPFRKRQLGVQLRGKPTEGTPAGRRLHRGKRVYSGRWRMCVCTMAGRGVCVHSVKGPNAQVDATCGVGVWRWSDELGCETRPFASSHVRAASATDARRQALFLCLLVPTHRPNSRPNLSLSTLSFSIASKLRASIGRRSNLSAKPFACPSSCDLHLPASAIILSSTHIPPPPPHRPCLPQRRPTVAYHTNTHSHV